MKTAISDLVQGNSEFALDLYSNINTGEGNRFLSPVSISTALAMTYGGAREKTASQMAKVLRFKEKGLHQAFRELTKELHSREAADVKLLVANALWTQFDTKILPDFQKLIKDNYEGGLSTVDFRGSPNEALKTINAWVEGHTNDKIKDLLKPSHINSETKLVLTNAIYFKSLWANQFDKKKTAKEDFFEQKRKTIKVDMMKQTGSFQYIEEDDCQILGLPYKGHTLLMTIFLPKEKNGLGKFESAITSAKIANSMNKITSHAGRLVNVNLPKFKMTEEIELADVLKGMGMSDAFTYPQADFSGINGERNLIISAVIHKAFVEVEETGTEAAAATAVGMTRCMSLRPEIPIVFRADHPFFFLISDIETSSILFLGRLTNPK